MSQPDGIVVRGGAQGFVQEITAGRHHLKNSGPAAGNRGEVSRSSHAQVRDRYQDDGTTLSGVRRVLDAAASSFLRLHPGEGHRPGTGVLRTEAWLRAEAR